MVMEALPSPDAVGREFVRQYYTLLNRAPLHAHRFYNSNSYFVHGAMSKPAIGQRQIHQKIQQLNFRDCHAKISQVDSQATLGNGVVVQVSGELSNDGEPMRRFTQTFVLGADSPRKYYVHNDIFRYQDMLLSDEEGDSPSRDEDIEQTQDAQTDTQTSGELEYFNPGNAGPVESQNAPNVGSPLNQNAALNGTVIHEEAIQGQVAIVPPQEPSSAPVVNGRAVAEELKIMNEDFIMESHGNIQPEIKSPKEKANRSAPSKQGEIEESTQVEKDKTTNENESFSAEMMQDLHISAVSNEPQTYANLLKSDRMGSGLSNTPASSVINRTTSVFNPPSGSASRLDEPPQSLRPPRGPVRGVPPRGNNRGERTIGPSRTNFDDGGAMSGNAAPESQERRRNIVQQYSDNHQLFMGNLPLDATEDDLRSLFSKYGTIVDLHIHSKTSSGAKGMPGTRVPNYGFITFEDPQSVQEVLNDKPICFPKDGGIKLNVEEKRVRPKSTLPSQGGGGGGGNAGGNDSCWTTGRQSIRGGPPRGSRGGGARGNFNRDSRGPPANQRSNFTQRR